MNNLKISQIIDLIRIIVSEECSECINYKPHIKRKSNDNSKILKQLEKYLNDK